MIMEIITNKWVALVAVVVIGFVVYRLINKKDSGLDELEAEYNEILTSDKYKVKGQYSDL